MLNFIKKIKQENPILFYSSFSQLALALLSIVGLFTDSRLVTGINPWIKPLKFEISIFIFLVTFAYVLQFLSKEFREYASKRFAICLNIEIALIIFQAARGVTSHFNQSDALGIAIFAIMGIVISYNTYVIYLTLREFQKRPPNIDSNLLLSIRYGLMSVLIGSVLGGYMSSTKGHTVGAEDGGPGILFLNWSRIAGDLRVAHFIGLHGIQILLALGILAASKKYLTDKDRARLLIHFSFIFIVGITLASFVQALMGLPLFT